MIEIVVQILGGVGAVLLLVAYALASMERITINSFTYQFMNLIGSLAFIVNTYYFKAYGPFALNVFWAMIAGYKVFKGRSGKPC